MQIHHSPLSFMRAFNTYRISAWWRASITKRLMWTFSLSRSLTPMLAYSYPHTTKKPKFVEFFFFFLV